MLDFIVGTQQVATSLSFTKQSKTKQTKWCTNVTGPRFIVTMLHTTSKISLLSSTLLNTASQPAWCFDFLTPQCQQQAS